MGAATAEPDVTAGRVTLLEIEALKREQLARIGTRDNQVYATLAALGLAAAAIQRGGSPSLLLALPPVVLVLGQTRMANDIKVSDIGRYLRAVVAPRLEALTGEPALRWEWFFRLGKTRRLVWQLLADMMLFTVAPAVALLCFWVTGGGPLLVAASAVEAVLVVAFAVELVRRSGLGPETSPKESGR